MASLRFQSVSASALAVGVLLAAAGALGEEVTIELQVEARALASEVAPHPVDIELAVAATREVVWRETLHEVPGSVTVTVPATSSGWSARAEAPGWWAPTAEVLPDARDVVLSLVPMGLIRLQLDGSDVGVESLNDTNVRIFGRIWNRGKRLNRGVYGGPCAVDVEAGRRDVRIACPFALGEKADLQVSLGPFLPWARTGVTVDEDDSPVTATPVRGASVAGVVRGSGAGKELLVALAPRTGALSRTVWTDARGGFLFEGVGEGTYDLFLRQSPRDRWTVSVDSHLEQIDVGELVSANENRFSVEIVAPSAFIEAVVGVRASRLPPAGTGVRRQVGPAVAAEPSQSGSLFAWAGLPAGRYRVFVDGPWGNRWHSEVVEFGPSGRHLLDLDVLELRGRVRRGAEPLDDVLVWLGGLHGEVRLAFRSRSGGHFGGWLPRRDDWHVRGAQVTRAPACDPCEGDWASGGWGDFDPVRDAVDAGAVEMTEDVNGVARLDIDLPGGRVEGKVLRVDGETGDRVGVPDALVRLSAGSDWPWGWTSVTSESGDFRIDGVPVGLVGLSAEARLDDQIVRSGRVLHQVEADAEAALEILLKPQRRLHVRVGSMGSPTRNVTVVVRFMSPDWGQTSRSEVTGPDGRTSFWLPESVKGIDLLVHAEGLGTDGWRFQPFPSGEVDVELSKLRGDLSLPSLPNSADGVVVNPHGLAMELSFLRSRGQVQDTAAASVVLNLAPGAYSYCPGREPCAEVQVVAGVFNRNLE